MERFLDSLNEPQRLAVTLPAQHALILAGAGSGKTRVLTTRIAWLIATGRASPQGILAVTFTNKAAREMTTRLTAMLPINTRGMWIGTFHGLCNRMLRAHYRDAALPQTFQILDSADQLGAIKRMCKRLGVDDERYPPRNIQYFINSAKEQGLRAPDVEIIDDFNRHHVELYAEYDAQCQREGVVDFAELLLRSFELLERNQLLREHYQSRFRHILVDEFQDTNVLQYRWLKLLAGADNAVFAVGDDDQSIYAFRGANVGNMAAFEREFRVRNLIKLEQNYRSHGHILDCANRLIRNNESRLGKNLWTDAGEGEPVRVYEAMSDALEARWLVEEVRNLVAEGAMRSDIAVLYRSNAQSRVIEHALVSQGIPYRVYGGLRFFERAEIKHALAYLRLIANPHDDGAFLRVVNFPTRGIGARSLEALGDVAAAAACSLHDACAKLTGAAGARLAAFVGLIDGLAGQTRELPLPAMIEQVIERSGLRQHYQNEREGEERLENLRELVNAAVTFLAEEGIGQDVPANAGVASADAPAEGLLPVAGDGVEVLDAGTPDGARSTPLAEFLGHASLEAGENQAGEGADALQLMTVHSAKGLEFQSVFLTGLEEGLFPHENSSAEPGGLEEERRLMYVAITRARERLYLSYSQTRMLHGQTRYGLKSRFIDELPPESLKWLTPRGTGRMGSWHDAPDWPARAAPLGADRSAGRDRGTGLRIGQAVEHARFGEGVVVEIEGRGDDARAQVNFGPSGVKWLALSVAKLTPL